MAASYTGILEVRDRKVDIGIVVEVPSSNGESVRIFFQLESGIAEGPTSQTEVDDDFAFIRRVRDDIQLAILVQVDQAKPVWFAIAIELITQLKASGAITQVDPNVI